MNKFIKITFTVVLTIFILIQAMVISNASSVSVKLTTTTTTVEKGKEVSVLVSLADIDVGEGVNTLKGTITYDSKVLEYVNNEAQNGWAVTYNSNDGTLLVVYMSGLVNKDQGIAKLTFKVKDTATDGNTTIGISNVESSNADEKVTPANASVTIKVGTQTSNPDNTTGGNSAADDNNSGSGTGNNGSGSSTKNNTISKTNSTTATTSIPRTGSNVFILITIGLIIAVIGIVSFMKYKKYRGI